MTYPGWIIVGRNERQITRQGLRFSATRRTPTEPKWTLHEIDGAGRIVRTLAVEVLTRDLDEVLEALVP